VELAGSSGRDAAVQRAAVDGVHVETMIACS
jgi:hypothetical protein